MTKAFTMSPSVVETGASTIVAQDIDLGTFQHDTITYHANDNTYWFYEKSKESFPGQAFGLEVAKILYHTKSEFQDILIFESKTFGNVLILNGIIQCTEKDEFAYQELITHIPIMSHPNPKKVLVIGGGDCGVIRELVKHVGASSSISSSSSSSSNGDDDDEENDTGAQEGIIDSITMVEIDDMVIKLLTQFLPQMAKYHNHPKVNLIIDDGFKFLRETTEKFDVIITDSSDPEGPAEEFFQTNYFKLLSNSLNHDGIVIMQSLENIWLEIKYLKELIQKASKVFDNVKYCQCYMPSYTSGQLGLIVATNNKNVDLTQPLRTFDRHKESQLFKYYNQRVHSNSYILPTWADDYLNGGNK